MSPRPPPRPRPPPAPVDRGWAWVVLGASMGCHFLNGMLCYFVGVVHTGLLHTFQASVTTTAWVGSLYAANMSLSAPIAALVVSRFGCRVCCISGGLLCFGGFLASAFAPSIHWLFLTYGLVTGIGMGLTYSPSIMTIGFYFDKYRGLAVGLASSKAAIGILSGSLIAQTLIDNYSVSGAFLILAAICLHFCFLGAFLRPTQYEVHGSRSSTHVDAGSGGGGGGGKEQEYDQQQQQQHHLELPGLWGSRASRLSLAVHGIEIRSVSQSSSIHRSGGGSISGLGGFGSVTSLLRRAQINRHRHNMGNSSLAASVVSGEIFPSKDCGDRDRDSVGRSCQSALVPPDCVDVVQVECEELASSHDLELEKTGLCSRADTPCNKSRSCSLSSNVGRADLADSGHTPDGVVCTTSDPIPISTPTPTTKHTATPVESIPGIVLEHVYGDETTSFVDHLHNDHHCNGSVACNSEMDGHSFASSREDVKHDPWRNTKPRAATGKASGALRKTQLLKTADSYVAVLTHTAYMCHCASSLVASIHISGVYLHLPEYVLTQGTTVTQAAALFVAVGISSLLSRLATGFATMDPRIECLTLNIGMMGLCGLATIFFPFYADTYTGQLVFSALFGLYTGGQYALFSVLSVHFMGVRLLPTALGVLVFFAGVGYVSGPPLAALIVDNGGTYQHSFIFLGAMMTFGSFLDMAAVYFSEPTTIPKEEEDGDVEGEGGNREKEKGKGEGGEDEDGGVEVEVASVSREWLGSTMVICYQATGSSSPHGNCDPGSLRSLRSRAYSHHSQDLNT